MVSRRQFLAAGISAAGAAALSDCSSPSGSPTTTTKVIPPAGSDLGAVEHVVFLMQENRSFDHYFGTYPGVRGFDDRSAEAVRAFHQPWPDGTDGAHPLLPYNLSSATAQICAGNESVPIHDWAPQHQSWDNGTNARFVATHAEPANDGPTNAPLVMGYYTREQLGYYYALADAYTICDGYHCSVIGPTMPNRLYGWSAFIDPAGTHGGPVLETPGFNDSSEAVASVEWDTMPEALSDHGVSWKVYQVPGTSAGPGQGSALALGFNALLYFKQYLSNPSSDLYQRAFLPNWPDEFTADVKAGTLPQVSWVIPPLAYSEHPNSSPAAGAWFVDQVVSTITSNEELWSKTVIFLTYDENGGFFDHVVPPTPPAGTTGEEVSSSAAQKEGGGVAGLIGLGFRVPMIVISPWSRGGWIDSGTFDHTSMLRFLETRFDVPVPNLTSWRRKVTGDLTSTLGFGSKSQPAGGLPATSNALEAGCPTPSNPIPFLDPPEAINVPNPGHQTLPAQESGSRKHR